MRALLVVVSLLVSAPLAHADEAPLYATVLVRFEGQPEHPKRRMLVDIQTYSGGAFTIELLDAKKRRHAIKKLKRTQEGVNETPFAIPKSLSSVHVWQGKRHTRIPCRIGDSGWECEPYAEQDPDAPSKNPLR
jgi:hypothetical protein